MSSDRAENVPTLEFMQEAVFQFVRFADKEALTPDMAGSLLDLFLVLETGDRFHAARLFEPLSSLQNISRHTFLASTFVFGEFEGVVVKSILKAAKMGWCTKKYRSFLVGSHRQITSEQNAMLVAARDANLWGLACSLLEEQGLCWQDVVTSMPSQFAVALREGLGAAWSFGLQASWPFASDWRSVCGDLDDHDSLCAQLATESTMRALGDKLGDCVFFEATRHEADVLADSLLLGDVAREIFINQVMRNKVWVPVGLLAAACNVAAARSVFEKTSSTPQR